MWHHLVSAVVLSQCIVVPETSGLKVLGCHQQALQFTTAALSCSVDCLQGKSRGLCLSESENLWLPNRPFWMSRNKLAQVSPV